MKKPSDAQKAAAATQVNPSRQQQQITVTQQYHQGPLPPASVMRDYDQIVPGAAERILRMAESETVHRQQMESDVNSGNVRTQQRQIDLAHKQTNFVLVSDIFGQLAGWTVCAGCVAGAIYLGMHDHVGAAALLTALPLVGIVRAFRESNRKPNKTDK